MIYRAYTQFNNYISEPYVNFILFCREHFVLIWIFSFVMSFHFYFVVSSLFCSGNWWPPYIFLASLRQFFLISFRIYFTSLHHFPTLFYFTSAVLLLSFIDSLFSFSIFFFYFPSAFLFFIFYPPFQISSFAHRFAFTSLKRLYTYLRQPRASKMLVN